MRVRNQDVDVDRLIFKFAIERQAEGTNACAGIQNNDLVIDAQFDARSVAAVENGMRLPGAAMEPRTPQNFTFVRLSAGTSVRDECGARHR